SGLFIIFNEVDFVNLLNHNGKDEKLILLNFHFFMANLFFNAKIYFKRSIATLLPSYFALVMATGIVSIAAHLLEIPFFSKPLFHLNIFLYCALWILLLIRFFRFPHRVRADLKTSSRSFGFLTIVAATCILGQQFVIFEQNLFFGKL